MGRDLYDEVCMIRRCLRAPMDKAPIPICFTHVREIGSLYGAMFDYTFGREQDVVDHVPMQLNRRANGVVYYIRIGDHVKIGTSTDLRGRMDALYAQPESLLATERGSYELEGQRHRQFDAERVNKRRELFNPSPRLLAHIENLRALAGLEPLQAVP